MGSIGISSNPRIIYLNKPLTPDTFLLFLNPLFTSLLISLTRMDHCKIEEAEIINSPYLSIIRDGPPPRSLFDAIAYNGQVLPPNSIPVSFLVSTSNWDSLHLRVLHVHCLNDLPLARIFPPAYMISEKSTLALRVDQLFGLPRDRVKSGLFDLMEINHSFYAELSFLLRTDQKTPSPIIKTDRPRSAIISAYRRSLGGPPDTILGSSFPDSSSGSAFSYGSSGEIGAQSNVVSELTDTTEVVTNNMVIAFLTTLSNLAYPTKTPSQSRPEFNAKPDNFSLVLMGTQITSINDGSGWKTRFSKTYNQWVRTGGAPLITLEVHYPKFCKTI